MQKRKTAYKAAYYISMKALKFLPKFLLILDLEGILEEKDSGNSGLEVRGDLNKYTKL